MTAQEKDRIQCAIDHIKSSIDVDPWAMEIAVDAMEKQIPKEPDKRVDSDFVDLRRLYCSSCGVEIGVKGLVTGALGKYKGADTFCTYCGQAIDWSDYE